MKKYLIAYDIVSPKRAYRVRKLVYEYAMGGQKSALEVLVSRRELKGLICRLEPLLDSGRLKKGDFSKRGGVYIKYDARRRVWRDFHKFNQTLDIKLDREIATLKKMIKGIEYA